MSDWNGFNRRKFPRLRYPCLVVVKNSSYKTFLTHTENVGIGGIGIVTHENIVPPAEVDIEIDLMDFREHIHCKGKVCWNMKHKKDNEEVEGLYEVGIEFINIEPADLGRIRSVLESLTK